jgi:hypothetical protein
VLEVTATRCEYRVLETGVHEFVMLEFSRAGVDAFVAAIERMNAAIPPELPRPILVDSGRGVQPLSYLFTRLRMVSTGVSGQPGSRLALLLQPGMMVSIVGGMMRIFPQLSVRFFRPDEREAALEWLLGAWR